MTAKERERFAAIHHVVHEYANFVSSAEMVLHGTDIDGLRFNPPINTHISHSFYLNCRKLADFFQGQKNGDDILAEHYVGDLPVSDKWRIHINKQLVHVTYFRDKNAKEINRQACEALYKELKSAWREFRTRLPKVYAEEFTKKVKARKDPYQDGTLSEFRFYDLD